MPLDRFQHGCLQMQVVDCIGGQAQLGIKQQVDPARICCPRLFEYPFGVIGNIGRAHFRRRGRHADEAVGVQIVERVYATIGHR